MSIVISRPNGKPYRPRKLRSVILGDEDSLYNVIVFGTHDIDQARAFAFTEVPATLRSWAESGYDDVRVQMDPTGHQGWWRREFAGIHEDSAMYTYPVDDEAGAAGVSFELDWAYEFDEPQEGWLIFSGEHDKRRPEERLFEVTGSGDPSPTETPSLLERGSDAPSRDHNEQEQR